MSGHAGLLPALRGLFHVREETKMSEAFSNSGDKLLISTTAQNANLTETEFEALTFTQVGKVGSVGERGSNTNILTYDTLDTDVSLKAKGITDAGSPAIEVAEDLADPGQIAMRAAGEAKTSNYAFKYERADGSAEYWRGLVTGPVIPGGRNEDFRLNTYTIALNQKVLVVAA